MMQQNDIFSNLSIHTPNHQVRVDDWIVQKPVIVPIGTDKPNKIMLYFAIKCWNKPIKPLVYLPQ